MENFDPKPKVSVAVRGDTKGISSLRSLKKLGLLPEKYRGTDLSTLSSIETKRILEECYRGMHDYRSELGAE